MPRPPPQRSLTDADVEAIVEALKDPLAETIRERFTEELYADLGRGVWSVVKKMIIGALLGLCAYGASTKGGAFFNDAATTAAKSMDVHQ